MPSLCHHLLPPFLILPSILSHAFMPTSAPIVSFSSSTGSLTKRGFIASSSSLIIHDDEGYSSVSSRTNRFRRRHQRLNDIIILSVSSLPSSSGYWIDENDPFVIVMNGDEAFINGKGDQGSISSSIDPDIDSAGFTQQMLQQQHYFGKNDINNDDCIDRSAHQKSIKFTIRGNPRVLIRHRSARGYTYNPSRPAQEDFRSCLLKLLPPMIFHPTIQTTTTSIATTKSRKSTMVDDDCSFYDDDDGIENNVNHTIIYAMDPSTSTPSSPTTLFSKDECLKLSITFRMKRPKSHFTANQPGHGRLKSSAPSKLCIRNLRSDIDNMTKFVMDSLNGLLYVDDRQVVELNVKKVLDCEGLCLGATDVEISGLKDV